MNNLRWLTSLFNFDRMNGWMFGKKRNNRGMIISLLSLVVGAIATYGMTRGRGNKRSQAAEQPITSRIMSRQMKTVLPKQ
ncbi:hypothetical protein J2S09_004425 [Bacillus fengqiuensis]|nr:hypothetical protein [Bacillus fengqiuensis]